MLNTKDKPKTKMNLNVYQKINYEIREKLIELVILNGKDIKQSAEALNLNFSTAKTIIRTFKLEKRISNKKNEIKTNKKFNIIKVYKNDISNKTNDNSLFIKNLKSEDNLIEKYVEKTIVNEINVIGHNIDLFNDAILKIKNCIQESFIEVELNQMVLIQLIFLQNSLLNN